MNPFDPDCPSSAPNKENRTVIILQSRFLFTFYQLFVYFFTQEPDIGAELTGGCYGIASKFMHWPEQLVVGGTTKNKTGHITR